MKIRLDYVTNSSSSSFIICSKINMCDSLEKYMSEEYGKYGTRLLKHCFFEGKDILDLIDNGSRYIGDNYFGSDDMEGIKKQVEQYPDSHYLFAEVYIEDTEGGVFPDDYLWLLDHIPTAYKTEIYRTEPNY